MRSQKAPKPSTNAFPFCEMMAVIASGRASANLKFQSSASVSHRAPSRRTGETHLRPVGAP